VSAETDGAGGGSGQGNSPPQTTTEEESPHPAPSAQGDIPLEDGALAQSRERKWMESFGISLLPVLVVVIARVIAPTGNVEILNPVDLCFAMLPAAVVVLVQLLERGKINPKMDIMPRVVILVMFTTAFSVMAVLNAYTQGQKADTLGSAANSAAAALGSAEDYIATPGAKGNINIYKLEFNMSTSETALKADASSADQSENSIASLVAAFLASGLFLFYSYRYVWSKL
jgi:hypothetical protein